METTRNFVVLAGAGGDRHADAYHRIADIRHAKPGRLHRLVFLLSQLRLPGGARPSSPVHLYRTDVDYLGDNARRNQSLYCRLYAVPG